MHTSASLALNESWDPDVRDDMEMMLNKIVPEGLPYRHSCEGPDDMVSVCCANHFITSFLFDIGCTAAIVFSFEVRICVLYSFVYMFNGQFGSLRSC